MFFNIKVNVTNSDLSPFFFRHMSINDDMVDSGVSWCFNSWICKAKKIHVQLYTSKQYIFFKCWEWPNMDFWPRFVPTWWGQNFTTLISDFTPKTMTCNELNINRSKQQRFDKAKHVWTQCHWIAHCQPRSREIKKRKKEKQDKMQPYLQGQPQGMLPNLKDSAWAWIHLLLVILVLLCKITKGRNKYLWLAKHTKYLSKAT